MKYTIAQILDFAADNCLASKLEQYWWHGTGGDLEKYSCSAMKEAVHKLYLQEPYSYRSKVIDRIVTGLEAMGCPVSASDALGFEDGLNEVNQQIRYSWLKFAATIAKEQGV